MDTKWCFILPRIFAIFISIAVHLRPFLATVFVCLPSCVIFYCYLRIFKTVRSHNINFQRAADGHSAVNVKEIKVARTLFVIVVFFSLCWTPILLIDIIDTIRGNWTFSHQAYIAYTFLATMSSPFNPVIYGVINKKFQNEYLKEARNSFFDLGVYLLKSKFRIEDKLRFLDTIPPFQQIIKVFFLTGFLATAVTIATVMDNPSF